MEQQTLAPQPAAGEAGLRLVGVVFDTYGFLNAATGCSFWTSTRRMSACFTTADGAV